MPAPLAATVYADRASVARVLSTDGVDLRLDDDRDGIVRPGEESMLTAAIQDATAEVNRYCETHYAAGELVKSRSVWRWCSVLAAAIVCRRRGNPAPKVLADEVQDVRLELAAVHEGKLPIEGAMRRVQDGPRWSNATYDPSYRGKQIRVERPQSERTPRDRPPAIDYPSEYLAEP
jgi:phage gp36-like protein